MLNSISAADVPLILRELDADGPLAEFRSPRSNYHKKRAMYDFSYRDVVALNLRWNEA